MLLWEKKAYIQLDLYIFKTPRKVSGALKSSKKGNLCSSTFVTWNMSSLNCHVNLINQSQSFKHVLRIEELLVEHDMSGYWVFLCNGGQLVTWLQNTVCNNFLQHNLTYCKFPQHENYIQFPKKDMWPNICKQTNKQTNKRFSDRSPDLSHDQSPDLVSWIVTLGHFTLFHFATCAHLSALVLSHNTLLNLKG